MALAQALWPVRSVLGGSVPLTLVGHAALGGDDVGVAAEALQGRDGALAHHRFPAERPVVDHLQHDGRRVHLILGQVLEDGGERLHMRRGGGGGGRQESVVT